MANPKRSKAIEPIPPVKKWSLATLILVTIGVICITFSVSIILLDRAGIINLYPDSGNSNVQDGNNEASTDDASVTPSIKIESATATLLRVEEYSGVIDHICIVKMSGTIAGPTCSFLSFSQGRLPDGRPGLEMYPFECPSWRYWGSSPICSRDPGAPTSTDWSITHEVSFVSPRGFTREIIAILDTAKQPVVNPFGNSGNLCTSAELDQQITDSVLLTC